MSPIDAAAAVPAKNVVGRHQSGGLAALTPNAVSERPAMARKADEPARAAKAIPAAPTRHAIAACQYRSPVRSEVRDHSTIPTTAITLGMPTTRPTVKNPKDSTFTLA